MEKNKVPPAELLLKDNKNNTCWHKLLAYIKNKYQIEAIRLLLPYFDKSVLMMKDNFKRTCLHLLSKKINSDYYEKVIKLFLPYLDKLDDF